MTGKDKTCNKRNNRRAIGNSLTSLFSILLFILLSSFVFAIPGSLTLQGKLTNLAGASQVGTYNFSFKIYDAYTEGNVLWQEPNRNITTDANGIYDIILKNLSALNFSEQYYLGISVGGEAESQPRINLTSAPYAFRANISEDLNKGNKYEVSVLNVTGNLTLGEGFDDVLSVTTGRLNISDGSIKAAGNLTLAEKITFSLGAIIDNLVNGFLRINSGLNITGNVSIAQDTLFVDNTSGRVGIGTASPTDTLTVVGSAGVSGSLNATYINATEILVNNVKVNRSIDLTPYQMISNVSALTFSNFQLSNVSNDTISKGNTTILFNWNLSDIGRFINYTINLTLYQPISNVSALTFSNFQLSNVSNNTLVKGDNASISLWNASGANIFLREITGNVGIGTTSPNDVLEAVGNVRVSGSLNATNINASRFYARNGSVSAPSYTFIEDTNTGIMKTSEDNLTLVTGGASRLTIDSSGNVGIGTIAPLQKFEVSGNILVNNTNNAFVNLSGPILRKSGNDIVISD